jgi:predicted nucleic acid-binding protein
MVFLDTNVISEVLRPAPDAGVGSWMEKQAAAALSTTAVCEAELLLGAALLPQGRRRTELQQSIITIFQRLFVQRILPFDRVAANAYAEIASARRRIGRPISTLDAQIAAIARAHGAAVATRNVADFTDCGIEVVNPWQG